MSRKHHVAAAVVVAVALAGSTMHGREPSRAADTVGNARPARHVVVRDGHAARAAAGRHVGVPDRCRRSRRSRSQAIIAATDEARGDRRGARCRRRLQRFLVGSRHACRRPAQLAHRRAQEWPACRRSRLTPRSGPTPNRRGSGRRRGTATCPPRGYEDTDLWDRCLTRSLPIVPGPYNNNIEIVQTPTHVAINHEMIHDVRIVPLDGRAISTRTSRRGSAASAASGKATRWSSRRRTSGSCRNCRSRRG